MMKGWMRTGLLGLVIFGLAPTAGADFSGQTLQIEWHSPALGSVIESKTSIVSDGIEFVDDVFVDGPSIDVTDTTILFFDADFTSFNPRDFNGFVFTDINGSIADITGVSITSQTGYTGFDASDITFDTDAIQVNFESVTNINGSNQVQLAVSFIPEPVTATLLGLGLLALAAQRRGHRGFKI